MKTINHSITTLALLMLLLSSVLAVASEHSSKALLMAVEQEERPEATVYKLFFDTTDIEFRTGLLKNPDRLAVDFTATAKNANAIELPGHLALKPYVRNNTNYLRLEIAASLDTPFWVESNYEMISVTVEKPDNVLVIPLPETQLAKPNGAIVSLEVFEDADIVKVVIFGDSTLNYQLEEDQANKALIFDFPNTKSRLHKKSLSVQNGLIQDILFSTIPADPSDIFRIKIELTDNLPYQILRHGNDLHIYIDKPSLPLELTEPATAPPSRELPVATESAQVLGDSAAKEPTTVVDTVAANKAIELDLAPAAPKSLTVATMITTDPGVLNPNGVLTTLDFKDTQITNILRMIAFKHNLNIVTSNDVKGLVTVRLTNVPWDKALKIILNSNGFDFVQEEGGILRIASFETFNNEGYRRAEALLQLNRAKEAKIPLLPIRTEIIDLSYSNAEQLALTLKPMLSRRGSILPSTRTNSLILSDISEYVTEIKKMIHILDRRTPQVMIEVMIVDVTTSKIKKMGIRWNLGNVNNPMAQTQLQTGVQGIDVTPATGFLNVGTLLNTFELAAMISAHAQDGELNVLSNPRIATIDNEEAEILVGSKVPITVADSEGNPTTKLQDIGIKLKVLPHITPDGYVRIRISPEVSSLIEPTVKGADIEILTTSATCQILVLDGQTAVIGGLLRKDRDNSNSGIPILRSIPILGHLFKGSNRKTIQRELMIFVTPHIVNIDLPQYTTEDIKNEMERDRLSILSDDRRQVEESGQLLQIKPIETDPKSTSHRKRTTIRSHLISKNSVTTGTLTNDKKAVTSATENAPAAKADESSSPVPAPLAVEGLSDLLDSIK